MPAEPLKLVQRDYTQSRHWPGEATAGAIRGVIGRCFSGVDPGDYYRKYFLADDTFERRLRLFYHGEQLVGYCLITFRRYRIGGRSVVALGASAGFLPDYRSGNNTVPFSIRCALGYWLCHPWQRVYFADTMLSPAMYRVMAKNMATIYPHHRRQPPQDVLALWHHLNPEPADPEKPFVLATSRFAHYSEGDMARFRASDKAEIAYYLSVNPDFQRGDALITVIPIDWRQVLLMGLKKAGWRAS